MTSRFNVQAFALLALLALWGCGSKGRSTPAPTDLRYTAGTATYRAGMLITSNVPTSAGGAPTSYAVSPPLPAGLVLNPVTGVISGTPTATAPVAQAIYTVTASNAGGHTTAALTVTVDPQAVPQDLPNMGLRITPLAPPGATFETLKPGSAMILTPATTPPLLDVSTWEVGQAVSSVVSADGSTLLVMTTGYNQAWAKNDGFPVMVNGSEWVFVFDNTTKPPTQVAAFPMPNAFNGLAFDPAFGVTPSDPTPKVFYVSGGAGDPPPPLPALPGPDGVDRIYVFQKSDAGVWEPMPALALGHTRGLGLLVQDQGPTPVNQQVFMQPTSCGVALTSDGQTMVVVNYANDSVTVFTGGYGSWTRRVEQDLRPGKVDPANQAAAGLAGGEYPFWVVVKDATPAAGAAPAKGAKAYVSSLRDREVVVLDLESVIAATPTIKTDGAPRVVARIKTKGQPNKMTLGGGDTPQQYLYVVEEQADQVSIIDTTKDQIIQTIPIIAPAALLDTLPSRLVLRTGANPNSVTLSPDGTQLWVTNGNHNAVSVVALDPDHSAGHVNTSEVVGLIPSGWYPTSVTFSQDGQQAHVINLKSPTGPNPAFCYSNGAGYMPQPFTCFSANEYNPMRTKAGFQTFEVPSADQLALLTAQVATNNRFGAVMSEEDAAVMAAVRAGIKHVIFILKENRTYDQILGELDVEGSDGDPALADFGIAVTPNQNAIAKQFVTLDRFLDTAEVSLDGWPWSTSARTPDVIERSYAVLYAGRELALEGEGNNRGVNVGLATLRERVAANPLTPIDADLLPGQVNNSGPDGPNNEAGTGYLWDNALRAGLTVRSYGFFVDCTLYSQQLDPNLAIPFVHDPYASQTTVAHSQSPSLAPYTDPYFRGFDTAFPDYYRYTEWARDFDATPLASLSLVRFMHDHTGTFDIAIDLVNTPELQVADNDYAVGLLMQKVANSPYAKDTLIFVMEDDAQDGGDHVDSHRSVAFVVGPYVKQGAVISTQYNTISLLRTIEEVLGLEPMNLNDALASPMADVFTTKPQAWSFTAEPSAYLYNTRLPLPPRPVGLVVPRPTQSAAYWAKATKGMDFSSEDKFDFAAYNRILWKGLHGDEPYPDQPTGRDLRKNRAKLLEQHRASHAR
jgi:DNA-binding beta-propeller fold protein YncE